MASPFLPFDWFETPTSHIHVDAAGDLKLLAQHGVDWVTFQVSSKAMSLASPVWRAMLDPNGPFRESQSETTEIAFPDDEASGLLILLLVAHLRFQDLPQEPSFVQLLDVCTLCDKYDCIALVHPWISRWVAPQIHLACQDYYEEWLFIAWTIGDEAAFERTGRSLILRAETHESGEVNNERLDSMKMPPGFIEGMPEARLQTITKLIELTHSLMDLKKPFGKSLYCKEGEVSQNSEACDDLSTGSLVRQLRAASLPMALWRGNPVEIASLYPGPVEKLTRYLQNMSCRTYPDGWHEICGFVKKLNEGVEKILADMPSGMNESHRTHMATQRSKMEQSNSLLDQLGPPRLPPLPSEDDD